MIRTKFICTSISDIYDESGITTHRVILEPIKEDANNKKIWDKKFNPRGSIKLLLVESSKIPEIVVGDTYDVEIKKTV